MVSPQNKKTAGSFDLAVQNFGTPIRNEVKVSPRLLLRLSRRSLLLDRALQLQRALRQLGRLGLEQERIEAAR
jgi:hypothetical protein